MRGEEHGASLFCQLPQQSPDPEHPIRIEAVDGLVEDQRARIAQQRRRDPEPLPHPQREAPRVLGGDLAQADQVDDLIDPLAADPGGRRHRQQVVGGGAARVDRAGLEQCADLVQGGRVIAVGATVDAHRPRRRRVEAEDHPHGR